MWSENCVRPRHANSGALHKSLVHIQRLTVIVVAGAGGAVSGPLATIFAHEQLPNWSLLAHMAIGCGIGSMGPQAALVIARKMTTLDPGGANE